MDVLVKNLEARFPGFEKIYTFRNPVSHGKIQHSLSFPDVYALNGAIYLIKRDILLKNESFYTENTFGFRMPVENSLDIDSPWDMHLAELILKDRLSR